MTRWIENGAEFAWLIDPDRQAVHVYQPGAQPTVHSNVAPLSGEGPVADFTFDLLEVWSCYE